MSSNQNKSQEVKHREALARAGFPFDLGLGLAFDISLDPTRPSGYKPAEYHFGTKEELPTFGELRLHGFAAAIKGGFFKRLIIIGKDEQSISGKDVYQGWAIREMLVKDCNVDPDKVSWEKSSSDTQDSLRIIRQLLIERHRTGKYSSYAIITSRYHKDRAQESVRSLGWQPTFLNAESFIVAACTTDEERAEKLTWIESELRKYDLVAREIAEIKGISALRLGKYRTQTQGWKR